MRITIEAKGIDVTDQLRDHINQKVSKLEQYYDNIVDAIVYLHDEIENREVELKLIVRSDTLFVKENGETFQAALDMAVDTIKRSLKRYKEKTLKNNG